MWRMSSSRGDREGTRQGISGNILRMWRTKASDTETVAVFHYWSNMAALVWQGFQVTRWRGTDASWRVWLQPVAIGYFHSILWLIYIRLTDITRYIIFISRSMFTNSSIASGKCFLVYFCATDSSVLHHVADILSVEQWRKLLSAMQFSPTELATSMWLIASGALKTLEMNFMEKQNNLPDNSLHLPSSKTHYIILCEFFSHYLQYVH